MNPYRSPKKDREDAYGIAIVSAIGLLVLLVAVAAAELMLWI